jgi:hypothetical protein
MQSSMEEHPARLDARPYPPTVMPRLRRFAYPAATHPPQHRPGFGYGRRRPAPRAFTAPIDGIEEIEAYLDTMIGTAEGAAR